MDPITLVIRAVSGALGGSVAGHIKPTHESGAAVLNTILGAIGGFVGGYFGGEAVGEVLTNRMGGQIVASGFVGLVVTLFVNMLRQKSTTTI